MDALVDYTVESDDLEREAPNPKMGGRRRQAARRARTLGRHQAQRGDTKRAAFDVTAR